MENFITTLYIYIYYIYINKKHGKFYYYPLDYLKAGLFIRKGVIQLKTKECTIKPGDTFCILCRFGVQESAKKIGKNLFFPLFT